MTSTPDILDTTRRRLVVAGSCFAAPALLLAAFLVGPSMAYDDPAASLADATARPGASVLQAVLLLASSAVFVPVLVGSLNLLRRRARILGAIGGVLFLAGICGHLMLVAARLVLVQMGTAGTDTTGMVDLAHRLDHGLFVVITPLELCFDAGLVLLFIGLRIADAVPTWVLGVIIAVAVAAGVLGSTKLAFVIAGSGGLIAGCYVGARIGRTDDSTWTRGSLSEPQADAPVPVTSAQV